MGSLTRRIRRALVQASARQDPVFPLRARRVDLGVAGAPQASIPAHTPNTTTFYGYDQDGQPVVETVETGDETITQFSALHHVTIQGD